MALRNLSDNLIIRVKLVSWNARGATEVCQLGPVRLLSALTDT